MKLYTLEAVDTLINHYIDKGGTIDTIQEGVLGYGTISLQGPGLRTAIIREVYLNEWSSGHSVRFYKKLPNKYEATQ